MKIRMIPLTALVPSPANVRKTGTTNGIEELAANIAALGLLQNLQVREAASGKFEVIAGRRPPRRPKPLGKRQDAGKKQPNGRKGPRRGEGRGNQPRENEMRQ